METSEYFIAAIQEVVVACAGNARMEDAQHVSSLTEPEDFMTARQEVGQACAGSARQEDAQWFAPESDPERRMGKSEGPTVIQEKGEACPQSVRLEDAQWISTLSEFELDLLITLKELVIKRAKHAGVKDLGERFDLRMIRVLGSILVEYLKERMQSMPELRNILPLLSHCGLANLDKKKIGFMGCSEDIKELTSATPRRKRMWEGLCNDQPCSKK
ncbi:hypothetical protein J5N97_024739 [Dioscorea zingiberensis]|uniref:Uncharacterized protein n=1 Tax=Dioscorea zingiberensis TaxID=325984 RepID=A0A9D5C6Z4_9LILI|nr:hypothetical protein J5N97_024739 [Dioscorea zingiberensis]